MPGDVLEEGFKARICKDCALLGGLSGRSIQLCRCGGCTHWSCVHLVEYVEQKWACAGGCK